MMPIGIGAQELLLLLLLFGAAPAKAPGQAPPAAAPPAAPGAALEPDLALVHPGAYGFAHVRVQEIWSDPALDEARRIFRRAGPRALAALDEQFSPKPSSVERVTTVAYPGAPDAPNGAPIVVAIIRFSEPVNVAAFTKAHLPDAEQGKSGGKIFVISRKAEIAVHFADSKTLLLGDIDGVSTYLAQEPGQGGGLTPLIAAAAGRPFQVGVNIKKLPIPPQAFGVVPEPAQPLLKAELLNVSMALGERSTWEARLLFPDAGSAAEGEKAVRRLAEMGKGMLAQPREELNKMIFKDGPRPRPLEELPQVMASVAALGGMAELEEYLTNPPVRREGSALALTVQPPAWLSAYSGAAPIGIGLLLPAVQKVRGAAARSQSMNNMKQIGLALHNYESANGHFPPAAIRDKNGKPLLSWRVAILPYIEQDALYRSFKLDEPWDSEHNKKFSEMVVKVYSDPMFPQDGKMSYTPYKGVAGPDAIFHPTKGRRMTDITDGTSNTLMVVADSGSPVPWAKPDDLPFDAKKPAWAPQAKFDPVLIGMADGSVRAVQAAVWRKNAEALKSLFTVQGGELTDFDKLEK